MSKSYRSSWARVLCCCLAVLCASWPTWASSQCGTFQSPAGLVSGGGANQRTSAIADLNGDGKPDLVVVNNSGSAGNNVFVLLGNGDGTFSAGVQLNAGGTGALAVGVGDFNGDGKPDLAVVNNNSQVVVFLNTTTGGTLSFGSGTTNSIDAADQGGPGPNHGFIAIGDIDGDGKLDIAVLAGDKADILLGKGDGTFQSVFKTGFLSGGGEVGLALADINGDGKLDLVVLSIFNLSNATNTNQLQVAINNSTPGSLSFAGPTTFSMGPASLIALQSLAITDINGDGKPDIVIGSMSASGGLFVFLNTTTTGAGTPTLSSPTNVATFLEDTIVAVDIDGDGKPDIIGVNSGSTAGATLINTTTTGGGTPTFTAGTTFTSIVGNSAIPDFISVADLNGDGQPDFVILNEDASTAPPATLNDNVVVLLGLGGASNTMIAAPSPALFGATVTFTATVNAGTLQAGTTPTGNVQFTDNNVNVGSPATLSGSAGTATAFITNSTLALGSHPLQAVYTGDANFCGSTSAVFNETISNQHNSTTTLSTSANPSNAGQSVTFIATVVSSGGPTPTGMVTFKDGASTLGSGSLNGSGMATLSTSSLTAGAHSITASYPGDANTLASNSSTLTQNVQDFTLGANTQTLTVKAGQSGMVTITLTPEGGFNSTVQLSCSNLPSESTCSFNPPSLTPNGAAVTSTLTFNTTAASALLTPATPWNVKRHGSLFAWLSFPSVGFVGLVWAVGAKRNRKGLKQVMLPLLLLFLAVVAAQGCSGNSSGGGGNPGTPPGTSAVSVAVSGAGLSHSLTLTITVTQ